MDGTTETAPETPVDALQHQVGQLTAEVAYYRKLYTDLLAQFKRLERGLITGKKAERITDDGAVEQLSMQLLGMMFSAREGEKAAASEEPSAPSEEAQEGPSPKDADAASGGEGSHAGRRAPGRKRPPEEFPRIRFEVLPPEVERQGLDAFVRIGEEISEVVERRRAAIVVVQIVRPKFGRSSTRDISPFGAPSHGPRAPGPPGGRHRSPRSVASIKEVRYFFRKVKAMDLLRNDAQNHHYISQAEQRLNSLNPEDGKRAQRIYAFSVVDREDFSVALDSDHGVRAERNLAFQDLFSFDIQGNVRANLEMCFGRYENNITIHTKRFLDKVIARQGDITEEFLTLFTCKILNFLRNPHCVKKILNTLGLGSSIEAHHPADADQRALLRAFMDGVKPYQESVLQTFGLELDDYRQWAKALFLMVAVGASGKYVLDEFVRLMLSQSFGMTRLFHFTDAAPDAFCLLSDRGHNDITQIEQRARGGSILEFNLTSKAFIRIALLSVEAAIPPEIRANERFRGIEDVIPRRMDVDSVMDDFEMLTCYNRNAVYQCKQRVFCGARAARGIAISSA